MAITNEQVVQLLKRYPLPTLCGACVLAAFLAAYFRMDAISAEEQQLETVTQELNRYGTNNKHGAQLQAQVSKLSGILQKVDERAPRLGSLASNLQYFYRLEADTGVRLNDVRQLSPELKKDKKTKSDTYVAIPFSLTMEGSFTQMLAYLRSIEAGIHFHAFKSVQVNPSVVSSGGESADLVLQMTIQVELLGTP
jgi:Tfp pilus assembly protein PilO